MFDGVIVGIQQNYTFKYLFVFHIVVIINMTQ